MGVCAPSSVVDYFDMEGESSYWDYQRYLFEETDMYKMMTMMMPEKPRDFDQWAEWVSYEQNGVWEWKDIMLEGKCIAGGRGGKGGMGDFIDWSEAKDRIIMTGADGSKLYIEMGATKIATSLAAATVAALTLY